MEYSALQSVALHISYCPHLLTAPKHPMAPFMLISLLRPKFDEKTAIRIIWHSLDAKGLYSGLLHDAPAFGGEAQEA